MIKICFVARSGQNVLYGKMSKLLNNDKFDHFFIVHNEWEEANLRELNVSGNIYNLFTYTKDNWNNVALLNSIDINAKELQYGIESMWSLVYMDRFLVNYDLEDVIKFVKLHISFYEEIIAIEKPDYYVNEELAIFASYLLFMIGKKANCKYIGFAVPRNFVDSKVQFVDSPNQNFYQLDEKYQKNEFNNFDEAKKLIERFIIEKSAPAYMLSSGKKPKLKLEFIILIFKYIYSKLFRRKEIYDYEYHNAQSEHIKPIINYFKYLFQKKYFEKPVEGQKYFLFPLQFQPEATTLVYAPLFEKQLYAIDVIAKSIPGDSVLYVKEHYAQLGHRESGFYAKLKTYPNVRLINPWCISHDLIQKSEGVIVLTSTMGWEALFYKKPVFIIGNVFYQSFKYANKITNIQELSKTIKRVLENQIDERMYQDEFAKYVQAYLNSMSDGGYCLGEQNTNLDENIEKLYQSLLDQISFFQKKKSDQVNHLTSQPLTPNLS